MIDYIGNVVLALGGLASLIGGLSEREGRRSNLLWALFCFSIAGIGFAWTTEGWQTIKGILTVAALAFFVVSRVVEFRCKGRRRPEQAVGR